MDIKLLIKCDSVKGIGTLKTLLNPQILTEKIHDCTEIIYSEIRKFSFRYRAY